MNTRQKRNYPARLEGLRRRFERWRQTHRVRSRIADPLWTAAVKMAGVYGIHRTARVLRVNYYALKKRVEGESVVPSVPRKDGTATTFIEFPPPVSVDFGKGVSGPCECTLEMADTGGANLRVHLKGIMSPDLAALCRSLRGCRS
jgi:hypothetical protein